MAFKISKAMLIRIKQWLEEETSSIDPNTAVNISTNTIAEDVQILIKIICRWMMMSKAKKLKHQVNLI